MFASPATAPWFAIGPAARDAPISPVRDRYPGVLLSHGTGGTVMHGLNKTIDWRIVRRLASGSLPASLLTLLALWALKIDSSAYSGLVTKVLGVALLATAATLVFRRKLLATYSRRVGVLSESRTRAYTILTGVALGILVTISSVGAGALGVTALLLLYPELPVVKIAGSDIAHAVPLTLVAGMGHLASGGIDTGVLVSLLCGSLPYPGSAFLAGNAAARVGAGLITMAVSEQMLPIYASSFHETTFLILPGEDEHSLKRVNLLLESLEGYRSLLLGPGMGQSSETREVILHILEHLRTLPAEKRPRLVIDADGLNNLSALENWWTFLPPETVITPHPGEMGRLCKGIKVSGGSLERLELTREKAREWQVTLLLKGACTIIAQADDAGNVRTRINSKANPAMATAGTGDVLAGMIAGLLAQGLRPFDAASAAVNSVSDRVSTSARALGVVAR